ncbi:PAS domain S-box protein [Haloarculaceae archaeon H-GB2-1]|nr:PAS domain S-box protein [Haloarculaceae archaeon H-GB2-1]
MECDTTDDAITVLAVTADREFATDCERHLPANADLSVVIAETVSEAVDFLADERRIDCIVSDHDLPDTDGVAFLQAVRAQSPTLPFILFTSEGSEQVASRAISANVTDYLIKEEYDDQWDRLAALVTDAVSYYRDQRGLVNTEARSKTLLDASNDMIAVVRDGHVEYVNETCIDFLGADARTAVIGQTVRHWMSTVGDTSITDQLGAVQAADRSLDNIEARLKCVDGDDVPVELTATHITWADRPAVVLVVRDIAERKESERLLRQFRRAVEAAGHAIYMTDTEGTITYVNPAFERITGYDSEVAVGRTPRILNSGEMSDDYYEELWETISAGEVWEEEIQDRRESGEVYYAHQTIAPLTDSDGEVEAYVAVQTDTSEQKEYEAKLRQYEHAIEGANDLIAAIDDEYRYLFANEAYREFHGFDAESVTGRSVVESIGAEAFENVEPQLEKAFVGQTVQYRMIRSRPVRPDRTFDIRYYPLTDDDNDVWGSSERCAIGPMKLNANDSSRRLTGCCAITSAMN